MEANIVTPFMCCLDIVNKAQELLDIISILEKVLLTKPITRPSYECCMWKMINTVTRLYLVIGLVNN
jgi:hypothetical protein